MWLSLNVPCLAQVIIFILMQTTFSLRPQENEKRDIKTLNGLWKFSISPNMSIDKWISHETYIPIPASYNDLFYDSTIRDLIGVTWYQKDFKIMSSWKSNLENYKFIINFASVHYFSQVWLNKQYLGSHEGGHLPFEFDVTSILNTKGMNILTVAVNNTLTEFTIPQAQYTHKSGQNHKKARVAYTPSGFTEDVLLFDFFNYAGIHRDVTLQRIPKTHIKDVNISSNIISFYPSSASISISIDVENDNDVQNIVCQVYLYEDPEKSIYPQKIISKSILDPIHHGQIINFKGVITLVDNVKLWWPYTMEPKDEKPGFQYMAKIMLKQHGYVDDDDAFDVYEQMFGVRSLEISHSTHEENNNIGESCSGCDLTSKTQFLVNGRPFYFRGFGWHEDSALKGRAHDLTIAFSDFNLIKWLGANSFRTSHYPYDEAIMDFCDKMGIAIINELPAVGVRYFNDITLAKHLQMGKEQYMRDKNRPSTFLWSLANEPRSAKPESEAYFKVLADFFKVTDKSRFITAALYEDPKNDRIAKFLDVIGFNKYHGWYEEAAELSLITDNIIEDLNGYGDFHPKKPLIMLEYGSETYAGLHALPSTMFSEEYQVELYRYHHAAFDSFRAYHSDPNFYYHNNDCISSSQHIKHSLKPKHGNLIGEMVWNFGDFGTPQTVTRVGAVNRKGLFTRAPYRQAKLSAYKLRERYWKLACETNYSRNICDEINLNII